MYNKSANCKAAIILLLAACPLFQSFVPVSCATGELAIEGTNGNFASNENEQPLKCFQGISGHERIPPELDLDIPHQGYPSMKNCTAQDTLCVRLQCDFGNGNVDIYGCEDTRNELEWCSSIFNSIQDCGVYLTKWRRDPATAPQWYKLWCQQHYTSRMCPRMSWGRIYCSRTLCDSRTMDRCAPGGGGHGVLFWLMMFVGAPLVGILLAIIIIGGCANGLRLVIYWCGCALKKCRDKCSTTEEQSVPFVAANDA